MTIWKWLLVHGPGVAIEMPEGAKVLSVQLQNGEPQLWALCNPAERRVFRTFRIYGTGWDIKQNPGSFIGTFQSGPLVFHVFEEVSNGG